MSEATQLLNNLDEINSRLADPSGEGHIIIGDDRFITVPDELKRIAVQYDHNIETVTFDCPRFWDDHDMSKMNVYINYLRSDKAPGVYKANNVRVDETDESIMHFDWTISKNVTSTAGNIVFLVCVKKADDEGNEENHWNSELCKDCYVSEGLEIDGTASENIRPDIIEQWYYELLELANSGEFDGEPGVGIASIEQTSVSTEDGGENIVTMTLTDGQTADVVIHNGSKGVTALPIVTCYTSDGVTYTNTTDPANYNATFFTEGRQFVFIPATITGSTAETNTTDAPIVEMGLVDSFNIKLRSANDQLTTVPIGMLNHGVPYTMTFSGEYWLVDSYVENSQEIPAQISLITATSSDGETYTYTGEYNEDFTDVAKQIIFVHVGSGSRTENSSENVKLQFELDDGEVLQHDVKLRSATLGTTTVPVGALKYHTPYTMTFTGEYWLIDSYMGTSEGGTVEGVTQSQMENYVSTAIADINQATVVNAESDDGITYTSVDTYEEDWLEEGRQIVFVPEVISDSGELKLHLSGMDKSYPISLRPVEDHSTVTIPVGLFQPKVPYIMTFSLDTWWVDSYIDMPNNNAQLPVITVESMDGETFTYSSSYIEGLFEKGRQIIVILDDGSQSNTTESPELSFEFNDGYESQTNGIGIRSELYIYNNVPIGALKPRIPYTMTFTGDYWLIDSYIEVPQKIYTRDTEPLGVADGSLWIDESVEGSTANYVTQTQMEEYVAAQFAAIAIAEEGAY